MDAEKIKKQLEEIAVIKEITDGVMTVNFNIKGGQVESIADLEAVIKSAEMKLNNDNGVRW